MLAQTSSRAVITHLVASVSQSLYYFVPVFEKTCNYSKNIKSDVLGF